MNYKETGFRAFYHQFCTIPLNEKLRKIIQEYPGASSANAVLTYGYIDREAGFSLEILAAAQVEGESARFADPSEKVRATIRIGAVKEEDFLIFDDEDGTLYKRYADKIDALHIFDANEEIEETRNMIFLDESRHEEYIDDVSVYLTKDGLEPELCWVRIMGLAEHCIIGNLLNEPHQNFGYHINDEIAFGVQKLDDNKIICISNMNPAVAFTSEALKDGKILKSAVHRFVTNRNEDNFLTVLEILRDSEVLVPCNMIMSDEDQKAIEDMIHDTDQLSDLVGKEITNKNEIRMIPDILHSGERYYFPIFSSREEMGEYGEGFSTMQSNILDVIPLARNNQQKLNGIVLNPFTEPFILDEEIWDIVEKMKSSLKDED